MTEVDVINDLMFCCNRDCDICSRKGKEDCIKSLLKDARAVIKMQMEAITKADEISKNAQTELETLRAAVSVKYTEEQLIAAVNGIINSFTDYYDDENNMKEQILAIGNFMRLVGVRGHIAVDTRAERMEILTGK